LPGVAFEQRLHAAPVAANPTYAQAGIIGRFFRVGLSYKS
jgi:hypothetical protein